MATVQFDNGHTVQFDGNPTQQQLDQFTTQMGWAKPQSQSPFNPHNQNSQFTQPTPAGATQMQYQPNDNTGVGQNFNIGTGIKQTANALTAPIKSGAKEVAQDTSQAFAGGVNQVKQGFQTVNQGGGNPMNLIKGVGQIGSGAVGAAFSPLAAPMQPVNNAVNATANAISNNPSVQKFANTKVGQNVAGAAENVANYANIAQGVGGAMETPHATNVVKGGLDTVAEAAKPGVKAVGQDIATGAKAVSNLPGKAAQGLENHNIKIASNEWAKPTEKVSGYKKANAVFDNAAAKGHDIADSLVRSKIQLKDNVFEGKYDTADTAAKLHEDANKASHDMLRLSLQKADAEGAPKTSVSDVIASARKNIAKDKSLTQETKDSLQAQLDKSELSLTKQYPQGMNLENLHDEKIVRDANSKYDNVTNNPATNAEAVKNKSIGDAARKVVETEGEKAGIPVTEFNAQLAKQHQMANYLQNLHGLKVPIGKMSKALNYVGKLGGVAVANSLGGGILADVAGYHLGGAVERLFEGMSNPLRTKMLDNLKTTNPEAFTKIQDYLNRPAPELKTPNVGLSIKDVSKAKPQALKYLGKQKPAPETRVRVNNYKNPYPKMVKPSPST